MTTYYKTNIKIYYEKYDEKSCDEINLFKRKKENVRNYSKTAKIIEKTTKLNKDLSRLIVDSYLISQYNFEIHCYYEEGDEPCCNLLMMSRCDNDDYYVISEHLYQKYEKIVKELFSLDRLKKFCFPTNTISVYGITEDDYVFSGRELNIYKSRWEHGADWKFRGHISKDSDSFAHDFEIESDFEGDF